MPDGSVKPDHKAISARPKFCIENLNRGEKDSLGSRVLEVLFRGCDYAIYRSTRGVYVQFSDDPDIERQQRQAHTLLCGQICELRYLTWQMSSGLLNEVSFFARFLHRRDTLYDHNMAQALMLLMESVHQGATDAAAAASTRERATNIANDALNMAVGRVTADNTIRYVRTGVIFGITWICFLLAIWRYLPADSGVLPYLLASITGSLGAVFSVIVRAEAFELKPCDDSRLNNLMSAIRVGIGGIAGPALLLLVVFSEMFKSQTGLDFASAGGLTPKAFPAVATLGLVGGFAERLVPNVVLATANKMEARAGTPVQAARATA